MKLIKISFISSILFTCLLASNTIDNSVIKFEEQRFSKNKRIEIKSIEINTKKQMPQKSWYGYIIDVEASMGGNLVKAKDIVFTNGELISSELFDIKTGESLKDFMNPDLTNKYYDKNKLIAGNHNAKDKIVIFSDPLCPFCMDYVPDVINYVNKNQNEIALYYYHFPLTRIHPAALPLVKLTNLAKNDDLKGIELKVYKINWDEYFDEREEDNQKIIDAFNKEFKTSFNLKDLENKKNNDEIQEDIKMAEEVMVNGTPTIFINGKQDKTKLQYEMLGN